MSLDNTLEEIDVLYNTNPVSPSIPRLQESILEKETYIAYLTDIIGIGFFVVYVKPPNTLDKKVKKPQNPSPKVKQWCAPTRRLFMSPTNSSTLCGCLTECPNGENVQ